MYYDTINDKVLFDNHQDTINLMLTYESTQKICAEKMTTVIRECWTFQFICFLNNLLHL